MELNELIELSLDELKTLQQEVKNAINIKSTIHYEIGDILLQKTDSWIKAFKIINSDYDHEYGWEYRADVIKFDKSNIIKLTGDYFYTESFELEDIETIKIDENMWYPLETLYNKYKNQLDKVFDKWRKKEDSIRSECMEKLWETLNKEL